MFSIIFGLIHGLLNVYKLLVIAYCVISLMGISANKWTELVGAIIEPGLNATRALMQRVLPQLTGKGFDWSPVVLYLLLKVLGYVLGVLSNLPLVGWLF
jgi:uncharacterized protein YggT (Ycf19 family)